MVLWNLLRFHKKLPEIEAFLLCNDLPESVASLKPLPQTEPENLSLQCR